MLICPNCGYRVRCCATDCPNCTHELEIDESQPPLTCDPRQVSLESWYPTEPEPPRRRTYPAD